MTDWVVFKDTSKEGPVSKVLIFGTFSLFTKAHLEMGIKAKEIYHGARIIYVPAAQSYIKGYDKNIFNISDEDRVRLLKQIVEPFGFEVSTCEIDGEVSGYTYDTVRYLMADYNHYRSAVCIGMDNVEKIIEWEKGVELAKENDFLVFTRGSQYNADALKLLKSARVVNFEEYAKYSSSAAKLAYYNKDYRTLMDIVVPEVYVYLTQEHKKEDYVR